MEHKVLAIIVVTIMVLSGLAVLGGTVAAQPSPGGHTATALSPSAVSGQTQNVKQSAAPVSSSIFLTPDVLSIHQLKDPSSSFPSPIIVTTASISLPASEPVYFYWSSSSSSSGIPSNESYSFSASPTVAGSTSIAAGTVLAVSGDYATFHVASGMTIYLIASVDSSVTVSPFTSVGLTVFTVSPLSPSLTVTSIITGNSGAPSGSPVTVSGSGYNISTTSVPIYFNYSGNSLMLGTAKVSAGNIVPGQLFTVPTNLPQGTYNLVAVDSTGVTNDSRITVEPAITLSSDIFLGGAANSVTVKGTGFTAGATISANSIAFSGAASGATQTNSKVTVSSDGSFSVLFTVSKVVKYSVPSSGNISGNVYSINATETASPAPHPAYANANVYVSEPTYNETAVGIHTTAYKSGNVSSGAMHTYVALGLPASTTFELMVGPDSVLSFTSDSYGASVGTFTVPVNLPAGPYTMTVANSAYGLSAQYPATLTIEGAIAVSGVSSGYSFLPAGYLAGETGSGSFIVSGTGFLASASIVISGSAAAVPAGDIGIVPTVSSSDFSVPSSAMSESNGSFSVVVTLIGDSGFVTGTPTNITAYPSSSPSGLNTVNDAFTQYVSPPITTLSSNLGPSSTSTSPDTVSMTVGGLGAALIVGATYHVLFGTTVVATFSPSTKNATAATTSFNVPSVSSGVYPINLELGTKEIGQTSYESSFFLVTNAGGTPTVMIQDVNALGAAAIGYNATSDSYVGMAQGAVSSATNSLPDSVNVFAFGYPKQTSPTYKLFSAGTLISPKVAVTTDANDYGAYFTDVALKNVSAGKYLINVNDSSVAQASLSNAAYFTVSTGFTAPPNPNLNDAAYYGYAGSSVSFNVTGLMPNTDYVMEVNGTVLTYPNGVPVTYTSESNGTIYNTFTVPAMPVSQSVGFTNYPLALALASSPSSVVAKSMLAILFPTSAITLSPGLAAFPTEPVSFDWNVSAGVSSNVMPESPMISGAGPIQVTVYLDGSPITTVQAQYGLVNSYTYLNGTFAMPNGVPGTVYLVSFYYSQSVSKTTSGYTPYGTTAYVSGMSNYSAPIVLSTGAGAFLVSISTSTLSAIIQNAIGTAMKVPLAELNASIAAINGTAVLINTKLGEMNTTLGILDATLAKFSGDIVSIKTTLGYVNTSLASINGTVSSNAAGISSLVGSSASIKTSLGTISGTITNVSGGVATIHTQLGNLTTAVGNIKTSTSSVSSSLSNTLIFEIVILVLVVITLALVAVVIMRGRKQSPPKEYKEEPKQPKQ